MSTLGQNNYTLKRQNGWSQNNVVRQLGIYSPVFFKIEKYITNINLYRPEQVARSFDFIGHSVAYFELDTARSSFLHNFNLELNYPGKRFPCKQQ